MHARALKVKANGRKDKSHQFPSALWNKDTMKDFRLSTRSKHENSSISVFHRRNLSLRKLSLNPRHDPLLLIMHAKISRLIYSAASTAVGGSRDVRRPAGDRTGVAGGSSVTVPTPRSASSWLRVREGARHFVPDSGVSESATNLYLPHPGLRRDHYQSFLLNCGSPGVWSICWRSLPARVGWSQLFSYGAIIFFLHFVVWSRMVHTYYLWKM